ncbi:molybdopterin oxidoreductase family protein [Aliivibrio kagoshimensis]|uniref:molybdopterin oxidoreductase family protein n=1 Tax=Aliivibrio kagoshimensis TaxID=2910230 RepID=UPI003D0E7A41
MMLTKSPWVKTTCAYCGVGCGVEVKPNAEGQLDVRGDQDHPSNYGRLCSKGMALGETVTHQGRMLHPSIEGIESNWDQALDHVAQQFIDTIEKHGPDSVAFYVSGQLLTEDYYVANKLMKGFIGSGNIDTNSRLCMSSTVAGHKRAFGSDTMPVCYQDLEMADMVVITGSNLAWCHPVLMQRLRAEKEKRPNLFIVVIDPRETVTCDIADLHLAIHPGTDVALFNGLLNALAMSGQIDTTYVEKHSQGFDKALHSALMDSENDEQLAETLGVKEEGLKQFYQAFCHTEKVVTIYSQGVNQSSHGTDKVNSIINCHLATGRIGRVGMGPFSVTGQPNAMGGREVGGLANTLAAHMDFGNSTHHQMVSNYWQTTTLAKQPGLKAVELFDAINDGSIKAVWIMATNPVVSMPDSNKIKQALAKCPLVVVSDCIADTDTTRLANVLLPAQGWSEKSGTVTNSERRISRQRRILPTPGEGKPDWWIISQLAQKMGFGEAFDYVHEGEIFDEYVKMTALDNRDGYQRDLNLIGLADLSDEGYNRLTPQQWPVAVLQKQVTHQRMFSNGRFYTPNGKANFIAVSHQQPKSRSCEAFPLILNSGRVRDHWHTMTRTGLTARLGAHTPEPYVEVNPQLAAEHGLSSGDIVIISSRLGEVKVRVNLTQAIKRHQLFVPIHWSDNTASSAKVSALISPNIDLNSGQPEFKYTPVKLSKWAFKSDAQLLSRELLDLNQFGYWVKQKVEQGYLYRIASTRTPLELMIALSALCPIESGKALSYEAKQPDRESTYRYANVTSKRMAFAYVISDNLQQQDLNWLQTLLQETIDEERERSVISGEFG